MDYVYEWDSSAVRRLVNLVGESRARLLIPGEHPLGSGLQAFLKLEGGMKLDAGEKNALAELKLTARTLCQVDKSWKGKRTSLVKALMTADECESLLFELSTIRIALKGAASRIEWCRFEPSQPDVRLKRPPVSVECKLLRSERKTHLDAISEAAEQHRQLGQPLVVAVGVSRFNSRREVVQAVEDIPNWKRWFRTHDTISAGLIFAPIDPAEYPYPRDVRELPCDFGNVTIVRSLRARWPLPHHFLFNGEDRTGEVAL